MSAPSKGVGWTALGVAAARALETARADRLFADHFAAAFVGGDPEGFRDADEQSRAVFASLGDYLALRTALFDEWITKAARHCPQVVLLAAGLDTRALRLDWPPGTRVFEVDLPEVLEFKQEVLAGTTPNCALTRVPADLRENWSLALTEAGLDPAKPTAWLIEGLLVYLSAREGDDLLREVSRLSAPGSELGVEHVSRTDLYTSEVEQAASRQEGFVRELSSLWRNESTLAPAEWLKQHGWSPTARTLSDLCAEHDRPLPAAFSDKTVALLLARRG